MATAITRQLNYSLKPTAPKGERVKRMIPSLANNAQQGYNMGDTIIFYIPAGTARQVWDGQTAYLNFSLTWTYTATAAEPALQNLAPDFSAASVIRRLDIYSEEGQLLESIDRYGELFNILLDVQQTQAESLGLSSMLGTSSGDLTNANLRRGDQVSTAAFPGAGAQNFSREYSIPLVSGMFQFAETYFPAYALSSDVRIEIILDTQVNSVVATSTANASIGTSLRLVSPNIHLDYVTLEPSVIEQMQSVYAGRDLVIHSSSYHTYENTLTNGSAGSMNWIIPARIMSVKALLTMWRRVAVTGVQNGFTKSSRTNPLTGVNSTFNFNCGGNRYPMRPITTNTANSTAEAFAELQKAFHAFGDLSMCGQLNRTAYTSSEAVALVDPPSQRGFLIGVNTNQIRGQNDSLLSGLDISKVVTYAEANITTALVGDQLNTTYAFHDVIFVIDANGNLSSKW